MSSQTVAELAQKYKTTARLLFEKINEVRRKRGALPLEDAHQPVEASDLDALLMQLKRFSPEKNQSVSYNRSFSSGPAGGKLSSGGKLGAGTKLVVKSKRKLLIPAVSQETTSHVAADPIPETGFTSENEAKKAITDPVHLPVNEEETSSITPRPAAEEDKPELNVSALDDHVPVPVAKADLATAAKPVDEHGRKTHGHSHAKKQKFEDELPARRPVKTAGKRKKDYDTDYLLQLAEQDSDGEGDSLENSKRLPSRRRVRHHNKHAFSKPTQVVVRDIILTGVAISVEELAQKMAVKASALIKKCAQLGVMVSINDTIDEETAALLIEQTGHRFKIVDQKTLTEGFLADFANRPRQDQQVRFPVVTVMGHVDHGKTSLLDRIRQARVAAGEAGGITQHIGAYCVKTERGTVTFLDTPGHAAFTAMRARGAKATDVVILVVAADDGVMPQTIEAIQHAKAAGVPIVVALNKIDKEGVDVERVKNELVRHQVVPEEWGGDTMFVPVSAKTGIGIDALLEAILLQAELLDLKSYDDGPAKGVIIESSIARGRGPVATVLVQIGTLKLGDEIWVGHCYGRVRGLYNDQRQSIKLATPSLPVEIIGLNDVALAGEELYVVNGEPSARLLAEFCQQADRHHRMTSKTALSFDDIFAKARAGDIPELNIVLRADVQGSLEALKQSLNELSTSEVRVNILAAGIGGISESDLALAEASEALVIGFNVRVDAAGRRLADNHGITVNYFSIIYQVIDTVRQALTGLLSPILQEEIIGLAEVREVYRSSKWGAIAGCMVVDGCVQRHQPIRVLRKSVVIYEGALESLRRFKEDAAEVRQGMECGIGVKNYNDVQVGDQIEVFRRHQVQRSL